MRKVLILLALWMGLIAISMAQPSFKSDTFAVHTPAKDTLWLLNGNELAVMTYNIWLKDSLWVGIRPKIIFVDEKALKSIKRRIR